MEDPQDKLKRHVELMTECAEWAFKAKEALDNGDRKTADRYLRRAESYLEAAKEFEDA